MPENEARLRRLFRWYVFEWDVHVRNKWDNPRCIRIKPAEYGPFNPDEDVGCCMQVSQEYYKHRYSQRYVCKQCWSLLLEADILDTVIATYFPAAELRAVRRAVKLLTIVEIWTLVSPTTYYSSEAFARHLDSLGDVNTANSNGSTELIFSAAKGILYEVQLLIARKAEVDASNCEKFSAMTLAAYHGHVQVMIALLDAGADINHVDSFGWTPIMGAAYACSKPLAVRLLLKRRADLSAKSSLQFNQIPAGSTVFDCAKIPGNDAVLNLLNNSKDITWSPSTHRHFSAEFKYRVLALLVLQHTTCSSSGKLVASHGDANNRFSKLPRSLLFLIIAFSAAPIRLLPDDDVST